MPVVRGESGGGLRARRGVARRARARRARARSDQARLSFKGRREGEPEPGHWSAPPSPPTQAMTRGCPSRLRAVALPAVRRVAVQRPRASDDRSEESLSC